MNPASTALLAELRAIELWDEEYWRSGRHARTEMIAMHNRRQRRAEILRLLVPQEGIAMSKSEQRKNQRVIFEVDVNVHRNSGVVPGRTVDISNSGMAAILPIELNIGEAARLEFRIGAKIISAHAIVKYRNIFRHGFQFVEQLDILHAENTCQSCGGTGFVTKPLDKKAVAFGTTRCPNCGGQTRT